MIIAPGGAATMQASSLGSQAEAGAVLRVAPSALCGPSKAPPRTSLSAGLTTEIDYPTGPNT